LESARPERRLFDDPYAVRFLPGRYRLVVRLARVPPVGRRVERYLDRRWPAGPRASAVVRTRLIVGASGIQIWAEAVGRPRIRALVRHGVDGPRASAADLIRAA